jgi:hypothetical protein
MHHKSLGLLNVCELIYIGTIICFLDKKMAGGLLLYGRNVVKFTYLLTYLLTSPLRSHWNIGPQKLYNC